MYTIQGVTKIHKKKANEKESFLLYHVSKIHSYLFMYVAGKQIQLT